MDQCEVLGSSETYVISRTWVTALRKYVEKTVNDLSKNALYETCGGIDRVDLTEVMESDATFPSFKGEDSTSKLTCENVLVLHRNSIVVDKPTMLMSNAPS